MTTTETPTQYRAVVTYGQEVTRTHWYRVEEVHDEFGPAIYPEEAIDILVDRAVERAARKVDPRARDLRAGNLWARPRPGETQGAALAAPNETGPPDVWGPRRPLSIEIESR